MLHVDENGLASAANHGDVRALDKAMAAKQAAEYETDIKKYQERSKRDDGEGEGLEAEYERLNFRDDQFDLSDAFLSIATALAAVAALGRRCSGCSTSPGARERLG